MKEKILVCFGGKSVEHDISIITALQAIRNLPKEYEYRYCYIDRDGIFWTADNLDDIKIYKDFRRYGKNVRQASLLLGENVLLIKKGKKFVETDKIVAILNCCHGNIGEDGSLAGVAKACDIAQTSPNVTSAALCMDKAFMKDVCKARSIETPDYIVLKKGEKLGKNIKFPCVVKPCNLGSSIGITVCKTQKDLQDAIDLAFEFDTKILIEDMIENLKEFNCACFCYNQQLFVSDVNEVTNKGEIYSFDDKYLSSSAKLTQTNKTFAKKIKSITEKAYKVFDCSGIVRVDFLYDEKQEILYVNEINTIPGSLAFYLYKDMPFIEILRAVIKEAMQTQKDEKSLIKSFDSDALQIFETAAASYKK